MPNTEETKFKNKILKVEINSGSDSDDSEHELSYYMKDKVKLMKEVLKLIKPKKIKAMAPDCIKHLDIVEINSMLLEELLGISNKRLQYIFNGENVDRETSSSDSDDEKQPVDVISLDDISDDDIEISIGKTEQDKESGHGKKRKHKSHKIKKEPTSTGKEQNLNDNLKESEREKLMSVLELLELQARARAIKSQLALEANKKTTEEVEVLKVEDDSDPDAVIIQSPEPKEIVLTSSDSENDSDSKMCSKDVNQEQDKTVGPDSKATDEHVILLDDETPQTSKVDDKMLDMKKQKLLSKVKKIKLIRNKRNSGDMARQDADNSSPTIQSLESNLVLPETIESEVRDSNIDNVKEIKNNHSESDAHDSNNDNLEQVKINHCEDEVHVSKIDSVDKIKSNLCNEIDNDEIVVINLDEDEMKGIEND